MYSRLVTMLWYQKKVLLFAAVIALFSASFSGCSARTMRYINPEANFSFINKVAVLPFNNLSSDRYAGEKVRSVIMVDLLSRGVFDVVEQGEVRKILSQVLRATGAEEGTVFEFDKDTLKLLGERLGVQAVILGSVDEYEAAVSGAIVSLSMRMLDSNSGTILWQSKSTASGTSVWRKIIGIEEADKTVLTRRAVADALDTLL